MNDGDGVVLTIDLTLRGRDYAMPPRPTPQMPPYTIVIPVLNDGPALASLLDSLRAGGIDGVCVVADGGSSDDSVALAKARGCAVVQSAPGRATQLRRGIELAGEGWVWMLHADSVVSAAAIEAFRDIVCRDVPGWGRFDVKLDAPGLSFAVIGGFMNLRSAVTGICTGDQGIFVHTELLRAINGMPDQMLMEDIELSRRLKRRMHPLRIRSPILTSARRWQTQGVVRTVLLMWALRLAYFVGVSPRRLHRLYYDG